MSKQEDIKIEDSILPFEPFIKVGMKEHIEKELEGASLNDIETNAEWKENLDSTYNPYLENEKKHQFEYNKETKENISPAFPPSSTEASTPSTQRSIPPPTVQPVKPTYIVTTTTENPSPTRRVHSARRCDSMHDLINMIYNIII